MDSGHSPAREPKTNAGLAVLAVAGLAVADEVVMREAPQARWRQAVVRPEQHELAPGGALGPRSPGTETW